MKIIFILLLPCLLFAQSLQLGIKTGVVGSFNSKDSYPELNVYKDIENFDIMAGSQYLFLITGLSLEYNRDKFGLNFDMTLLSLRSQTMEFGINSSYKFFEDLYGIAGLSYIFNLQSESHNQYTFNGINRFAAVTGLGYDFTNNFSANSCYYFFKDADYLTIQSINGPVVQNRLKSLIKFDLIYKFNL